MVNIERKNELIQYLKDKKVISEAEGYSVNYCKGGVSCIAAFIMAGEKPVIIKQARAKLAVAVEWLADRARIAIESKGNEIFYRYVPQSAPQVYFYDPENYILVREAAPEACTMWKEDLLNGILDFDVARQTMEALAIVHNETFNNPEMARLFADCSIFEQLRVSPYIDYVADRHPELAETIANLKKRILNNKQALVHADYSPKNILVYERKICILDYEISHFGDPMFDVAFFLNHIALKSLKNKQWAAAYLNMLEYMADVYFSEVNFASRQDVEAYCVQLLGLFMLARVDGKSPVEYLTEEGDKQLARDISQKLLEGGVQTMGEATGIILDREKAFSQS